MKRDPRDVRRVGMSGDVLFLETYEQGRWVRVAWTAEEFGTFVDLACELLEEWANGPSDNGVSN